MATDTDIANLALLSLKLDPISSLASDTTHAGGVIRLHLPLAIATLMELHPWEFAIRTADLADPEDSPDTPPYLYAHTLPNDWLYTVAAVPADTHANLHIPTVISSGHLLAGFDHVRLTYIANDTTAADLPDWLVPALAAALARSIAMPLTGSADFLSASLRQFQETLSTAISANARRAGGAITPIY